MRSRRLGVLLASTLFLASCGNGESADTTSTTETVGTTSVTSPPTTVVATTTTVPPTTTTTQIEPPANSECSPGTEHLPDGTWYGLVAGTTDAGDLMFDLACWFTGEEAVVASAEDGEESPPPNDYYVRNENATVRILAVAPDTPVTWYETGDPASEEKIAYEDWGELAPERGLWFGIWIRVEGGSVISILEQWVP